MMMEDSKMSKIEYDLKAIMYSVYDIPHRLCVNISRLVCAGAAWWRLDAEKIFVCLARSEGNHRWLMVSLTESVFDAEIS